MTFLPERSPEGRDVTKWRNGRTEDERELERRRGEKAAADQSLIVVWMRETDRISSVVCSFVISTDILCLLVLVVRIMSIETFFFYFKKIDV